MQTFLQDLARHLYGKYGKDLQHYTLFFPNNRAALYFMKYLGQMIEQPMWAPATVTIKDYVHQLTPFENADRLTLIFDLYEIFKKHTLTTEDFDRFYFWGEMLLNDFDELDKYLGDANAIFSTLLAEKEIKAAFDPLTEEQQIYLNEFWSSIKPNGSKEQRDFLDLWRAFKSIYTDYRAHLLEKGYAYEGLIYRHLVDDLKAGNVKIPKQKLIIAGFNALNASEKALFTHLQKADIVEFYWDVDQYYLQPQYEAGFFMRENLELFPMEMDFPIYDGFSNKDSKHITVLSVPQSMSQAKQVGNIFTKSQFKPDETAIVLPNEQMLFPVLYSLPIATQDLNVTMGYSMRNTPLFALLESLIALQTNLRERKNGQRSFYHRDVTAILSHPYLSLLNKEENEKLVERIKKFNLIHITEDDLAETSEFVKSIFRPIQQTGLFYEYLIGILQMLYKKFDNDENTNTVEQEYIYQFYIHINRLREILKERTIELTYNTLLRLLGQWLENTRIPFSGEPLKGLQVMGLLETRLLDFKNVFILNMNEKIMPPSQARSSFIPYHLRKAFGLPAVEEQNAINAYYFYRLIQRAENVHLLYSVQKEDGGSQGEMSRYILQLKYEAKFKNFIEQIQPVEVKPQMVRDITIEKHAEIVEKLNRYLWDAQVEKPKFLSPSALSDYMSCTLRFYFKHVAGIKEPDEVEEDLDKASFGTLFHYTMESLYKDVLNEVLSPEIFDLLKQRVPAKIEEGFREQLKIKPEDPLELEGRNILIREVVQKYATQMLELDSQVEGLSVKFLEAGGDDWIYPLPMDNGQYVRLGGNIDRIDSTDKGIRLLDYKTGKAERDFKQSIEMLFSDSIDRNKTKAGYILQTLIYALIYNKSQHYSEGQILQPGLIVLKDLFADNPEWTLKIEKETIFDAVSLIPAVEEGLSKIASELFDVNIPFVQTKVKEHCQYCPYAGICHKD